jgi:hypothetical protein
MGPSLFGVLFLTLTAALAQQSGRLIVSAEPNNRQATTVERDDVSVEVNQKPARVTSWIPLTGHQAQLQLYIVIDDADSTTLGVQFGDLKNFINAQPPRTQIGIAYLRYGAAEIAQAPTPDHARAAKALRIPLADPGIDASPYVALSDLIKKWPPADGRREMLLIMSGIDPYYLSPDIFDPYLQQAVEAAQKVGIVASSIYFASAGHFGHSFYRITWGQNDLSLLDEDLGGEFYWQGLTNPLSFQPFLNEFSNWLTHQYLLTVETVAAGKPGLQPVTVMAKHGISLHAASKIFLGAPESAGPVPPK